MNSLRQSFCLLKFSILWEQTAIFESATKLAIGRTPLILLHMGDEDGFFFFEDTSDQKAAPILLA